MNAYEQSQSFAEINNISLHYSLEGDETKPLLTLINMASHNLTCWEVVLDGLLEHFRVLRFDIRGTGRSGWGAVPYTHSTLPTTPHVCTSSLGAALRQNHPGLALGLGR